MYQRDYILSLVEKLALVLSKVLGLKQQGEYQKALAAIHQSLTKEIEWNAEFVEAIGVSEFLAEVKKNDLPPQKINFLAELLALEAEIYEVLGEQEKCIDRRVRALLLFSDVLQSSEVGVSLELITKMPGIIAYLSKFQLLFAARVAIHNFYYSQGSFAKAEDTLFEMLESNQQVNEAQRLGELFYQNLLKVDDKTLLEGNLPRHEVEEGYKDFLTNFLDYPTP